MKKKILGKKGEEFAKKFLQQKGYKILTTNFHSRFGEIDIIAQEKNILVFVEVKTRWSKKFGLPEEAVTPWKIDSIIKTAQYFKMLNPSLPELLRIDVVAISLAKDGKLEEIKLIKNASQ